MRNNPKRQTSTVLLLSLRNVPKFCFDRNLLTFIPTIHKFASRLCPHRAADMSEDESFERRFTILYGTQTGNAQDVAERISRQARRQRYLTNVHSMEDYDIVSSRDRHS
jgi:sulfite reductase alpha subunit-like flavoprotein